MRWLELAEFHTISVAPNRKVSYSPGVRPKPDRRRLFALQISPGAGGEFVATRVGKICTKLVADLEKDNRFTKYTLDKPETTSPKDLDGLNIGGLATTPEGALLIGFRNPLSGGKVQNGRRVGGKA